jgi:predicted tellurium resistance membrane protein TerC
MLDGLLTTENLLAFVTLTALEIVLGIDNIVFIAILSGKLPPEQQKKARQIGLLAAMGMRILLVSFVGWIVGLKEPWTTINIADLHIEVSGRNLILVLGGLILMVKSVREIHHKASGHHEQSSAGRVAATLGATIIQIMIMDLVFSIDSVITAVGMAKSVPIMIAAVIASVGVMMIFAEPVSNFVERRPTLKMLALSFLLLIGFMLVTEGIAHQHAMPKGYIYFAMAFALGVEFLNMWSEKSAERRAARERT